MRRVHPYRGENGGPGKYIVGKLDLPDPELENSNRRLQPLRDLHDCSDCFRLERLPGGACTPWKAPPCHGAQPTRISIAIFRPLQTLAA